MKASAGTGKSVVVRALATVLTDFFGEGAMRFYTPMGKAANNIQSSSPHATPDGGADDGIDGMLSVEKQQRVKDSLANTRVICVEEGTLMSPDTLHYLDQTCRHARDKDKVFGGIHFLIIGDLKRFGPFASPFTLWSGLTHLVYSNMDAEAWPWDRNLAVSCYMGTQLYESFAHLVLRESSKL
jgi:hypothetical protein